MSSSISGAEAEMSKKYGAMGGQGGPRAMNSIMRKRLQGGGKHFFDSGDYNMNQGACAGGQIRAQKPIFPPAYAMKEAPQQQQQELAASFKKPTMPTATSPKSKLAN